MRTRTLFRTTVLLFSAGLAGFTSEHAECAAQTREDPARERLSLSAAIEEARRSPFYAWADGNGFREAQVSQRWIDGAAASHPFPPGPQERILNPPTVAFTILGAGISHLVAMYLFFRCGFGQGSAAGCMLGPLVPLPVVAAPLWLAGVEPDRALGVSAIGLLGGAAGFILGGLASKAIGINPYALALTASSMVHSGIVLAMVR